MEKLRWSEWSPNGAELTVIGRKQRLSERLVTELDQLAVGKSTPSRCEFYVLT